MFSKTKRNRRKTIRQTLSTEQLEPKAMFNAAPLQAEIGFEDRLSDDYDANDAVFQIGSSQNITCNVGFVGGGNHTCNADRIWTNGGASTLRIGTTAGPGGSTFMTGDDGHMIVHPQYNVGEEGRMIIHPQFNVGEDGRMIIHPQFNVGEDGRMVIEPVFNVGEDGRSIVHPQYNITGSADPGGDDIFMPKPNRGVSLHDSVHCLVGGVGKGTFTPVANANGTATLSIQVEDGRMIVHPQYNVGEGILAQANQQPNLANVWTNGSATSMAPRHAAFARMGR
jgi:hypothetical protein